MKDRNAWVDNKIDRGVDPTEAKTARSFGVVKGDLPGLVPADPYYKGVPEAEARGLWERNYDTWNPPKAKPACSATTKKGLPCKAAPVKGEQFCVGHSRVKE